MKVLVTGATGFVGRAACRSLARKHQLRLVARALPEKLPENIGTVTVRDIGTVDWTEIVADIDAVLHLAGHAHVTKPSTDGLEDEMMRVNFEATKSLATACCGRIGPFVFASTIGVHGTSTDYSAISETSHFAPVSAYACSKLAAEEFLSELKIKGDLDCRIVRPPLVYGPAAPGNLAQLGTAISRGIPLPLASVENRRNLIGLDHLAAVFGALLEAKTAVLPAYVVADQESVSTPDIVRALADGMRRPARLFPMPVPVLRVAASLTGQSRTLKQLIENLEVDASAFRQEFGDLQMRSTIDGLRASAAQAH